MSDVDLADLARRPQRYWDVDGLPELSLGLLWILWGVTLLLGQRLQQHGAADVFWTVIPVLLAGSSVAAMWVTKRLKARLTFPRTGYVEWKEPSRAARLSAAALAIVVAALLAVLITRGGAATEHLVAPVFGLVVALAFVVVCIRERTPRYLSLAAVALASGLAVGATKTGWESVNWMFFVLGAASMILGGLRLQRFLREHPSTAVEAP